MVTDWCFRNPSGERNRVLEKFRAVLLRSDANGAILTIRAFEPDQLDTLGQAVKDNILYYDPVEGAYGVQGKSLEWGIKGYFEEA